MEACTDTARAVLRVPMGRERYIQARGAGTSRFGQNFEAITIGQANVAEQDIELQGPQQTRRRSDCSSFGDQVAPVPQQLSQSVTCIRMILDQKHVHTKTILPNPPVAPETHGRGPDRARSYARMFAHRERTRIACRSERGLRIVRAYANGDLLRGWRFSCRRAGSVPRRNQRHSGRRDRGRRAGSAHWLDRDYLETPVSGFQATR